LGKNKSKFLYELSFSFKVNNGNKKEELVLLETRLIWNLLPSGKKETKTDVSQRNIQTNGFLTREFKDLKFYTDSKLDRMEIKLECDFSNHNTLASNWIKLTPKTK